MAVCSINLCSSGLRSKVGDCHLMAMAIKPKLFTLVVVHQGNRLLLGKKKRGFGEGYYNGFGGKVEPGESIVEAANRELVEEAGILAQDLERRGVLTFVFDDREQPWEVHVFLCTSFTGTITESEEMRPEWFGVEEIPFTKMWADDIYWYPLLLEGKNFIGKFFFQDTHTLLSHTLDVVDVLQ